MGNWQRQEKEKERVRGGGEEREVGALEKTERLWMKRMESLESVGLYLSQVARQPMSNRGERDGGQEEDHTG